MNEVNIIAALSELTDDEAVTVAEAMFLGQTALGRAVQRYIAANVTSAMNLWAIENARKAGEFQETRSNIYKAIVKEVIQQSGDSAGLPIQAFYNEDQACKFFQKGPQFLRTRRAKGEPVPQHINFGGGYSYAFSELMAFSEKFGPIYEPGSKDKLMEEGLEAVAMTVGELGRKIEANRKLRAPSKNK